MCLTFDGIHIESLGVLAQGFPVPILPEFKIVRETVPGRGDIYLRTEPGPKTFEIDCVIEAEDYESMVVTAREVATLFNPMKGLKKLILDREPDKYYRAIYTGKLSLTELAAFGKFNLQLTAPSGYSYREVIGSTETFNSSPKSYTLVNYGEIDAPIKVTITGAVSNPVLINDTTGERLALNITTSSGGVLIIDFSKMSVLYNGANALAIASGNFWKLKAKTTNYVRLSATTPSATAKVEYSHIFI